MHPFTATSASYSDDGNLINKTILTSIAFCDYDYGISWNAKCNNRFTKMQ
jgi:hypothetical protein